MKNLQEQLNQLRSIPEAAVSARVNYRKLQLAVQKGEVPSYLLPGGHRAIDPDAAAEFAAKVRQ